MDTTGVPVFTEIFGIIGTGIDKVRSLVTTLYAMRGVIGFVTGSLTLMAGAFMLASWWAGIGGLYGVITKLLPALSGLVVRVWAAMAPFIMWGAILAVVSGALAFLYMVYEDLSSSNSWIEEQAALGAGWAQAITGARDAFVSLYEWVAKVFSMSAPEWFSAVGNGISGFFNGMLGAQTNWTAPGLMPNQQVAAGGAPTAGSTTTVSVGTINQQLPPNASPSQYSDALQKDLDKALSNAGQTN
jgi:hypothetical protein